MSLCVLESLSAEVQNGGHRFWPAGNETGGNNLGTRGAAYRECLPSAPSAGIAGIVAAAAVTASVAWPSLASSTLDNGNLWVTACLLHREGNLSWLPVDFEELQNFSVCSHEDGILQAFDRDVDSDRIIEQMTLQLYRFSFFVRASCLLAVEASPGAQSGARASAHH